MKRKVLLVNWDNYPNVASGGVYVWAKRLVESIPDCEFVIINQLTNPNANAKYITPANVKGVIEIPVFGTHRYEEYLREDKSLVRKVFNTSEHIVNESFIPLFHEFLENVIADNCDPKSVISIIMKLHHFFDSYDSKKCLGSHLTWETFLDRIQADPLYRRMSLREALTVFQSLQRSIQILSLKVPKVDVVHCSLAWLPSLVAIIAKMEYGCPVLVTEHGVAYRELMLYYNGYLFNEPSKIFWKVFARNIVRPIYECADIIAPVCQANATWEKALGASGSKIRVIYNGIDTEKFKPMTVERSEVPTVVSVARIDPFKDITTLAHAIKRVTHSIPTIRCLVFGESNNLEYSRRCQKAVVAENLEKNFIFMGGTKEPEKAYNLADVVVFSGITEGFPFAVIEAMACGKAIVATSVGGVPEALSGCGVLVKSRDPDDLSRGIVKLLKDVELRQQLGNAALERARKEFSISTSIDKYRKLYEELSVPDHHTKASLNKEVLVAS